MKSIVLALLLTLSVANAQTPDSAPITQKDVIQLLQLKTPESEIIERLKKSGSVFVLGTEDEARLKRAGASEAVIAAMKGGGQAAGIDAAAYEISDLALVVDYSGSMNAKTKEGPSKMAAAKEAVGKLIDKLPGDLNVSVIVYGVSKQRGCEDIDLVQPLGPVSDKAALKSKLLGLTNTGMTPIASSLELAGRSLEKAKGGRAIVLVTDGVESCKGDPSAVASKLASQFGVKFGLHVIGFDIKADERASLEQIAKNGHGKYFNADNATQLASAMQKVTQQVAAPEPKQRETRQTELAGKEVKPGAFFSDAPLVEPGEYKGQLAMMQAHYYQIAVRKGQELRAIGIVQKTPYRGGTLDTNNQVFRITIYQEDLSVGGRQNLVIRGNPTTPGTFKNSWTATSDGIVYVAISASDNVSVKDDGDGGSPFSIGQSEKPAPSPYTLRLRVEGEGVAAASAPLPAVAAKPGAGFQQAAEIPIPVMASTDLKLGEVAYYRAKVQKGDTLQVSAAFRKPWYLAANDRIEATYALTLYDDDQVQVTQEKKEVPNNPADAQSMVLSWPVTMSGNVYVSIGCENSGWSLAPNNFQPKPGEVCLRLTGAAAATGKEAPSEGGKDPFAGADSESTATPAAQSPTAKE
jgi:Mg-chelatase subunit ChlD